MSSVNVEIMRKLLKNIYTAFPFKKELFSFIKLFWIPKESIFRHLHFKGVINVSVNESNSFKVNHYGYQIENEIFWLGLLSGWEKESIKLWVKLCLASDVIVDIGANTGIYSLIAKSLKPSANVYAFEPIARVFSKLEANIALNGYNITAIKKAVSNENGTAVIFDTNQEHVYSVTVNKNLSAAHVPVFESIIDIVTLDCFVEYHKLSKIDLIKIDVETHEPEVLEGFNKYLSLFKPSLLIEILTDEVGVKVQTLLEGLDYLYFNIDENGGVRQVEKIVKSDYYNFLICSRIKALELGLIQA
jgi:FkbM family methyltransferase